jgi:hypothetical protein
MSGRPLLSVPAVRMSCVGERRAVRRIGDPVVAGGPAGVRIRTRIQLTDAEAAAVAGVGSFLGSVFRAELASRVDLGGLDRRGHARWRAQRKQVLTAVSSSRWAGAITRASEDGWQLASRNLTAEIRSLRARIGRIRGRLVVPAGERRGRLRGYASPSERFEKQRRLQVLRARLAAAETRMAEGRLSVCRGGRRLARVRHHLGEARLTEEQWRGEWEASRLFICADGEADKAWGNETIRWHPEEGWLEIKLPPALVPLANRPHDRYRLSCSVAFPYRGDEVAAQTASAAIRYDISCDPAKGRWYLDASWKTPDRGTPRLDELRQRTVLAVDVNADHLAAVVVDPSGNPVAAPMTVPLRLTGLPAPTRDGRVRAAVSALLAQGDARGCRAVIVEDLDFADARAEGRELRGRRPSRGRRGRAFRHLVAGIPTARFRDRLVQMATNRGLHVVAVDPAYTSRWGAEHWLGAVQQTSSDATGHHAAALVIGRRGLGQRARRRGWCDSTRPVDRNERATDSAVRTTPAPAGLSVRTHREPGNRETQGQPPTWHKTRPADRHPPGDQAAQDRSGLPARQGSLLLSVQER